MILIVINNRQPIPLMCYTFILLFFRILALEIISKILTTGPRLGELRLIGIRCQKKYVESKLIIFYKMVHNWIKIHVQEL